MKRDDNSLHRAEKGNTEGSADCVGGQSKSDSSDTTLTRRGSSPVGGHPENSRSNTDGVASCTTAEYLDSVRLDGGHKLPLVEDFYTIQGEGYHTGKPAYFIRLGGCDVGCKWCDAKVTWNPKHFPPVDVDQIVARATSFPAQAIVITGGEPLLYPLEYLTVELHKRGLEIFLETSGSHPLSGEFDWICLSPKRQQPPQEEMYSRADELKVIVESESDFEWAEACAARVDEKCLLFLQPEWSRYEELVPQMVKYVKQNPRWNISIQTHKFLRIP